MIKLYGKNCIKEAIRANHKISEIFILDSIQFKEKDFILMLKDKGYKINISNKRDMDKIFSSNHQGMGAYAFDYEYKELEEIINKNERNIILILDGISDPHNLGAIIRSCDAFGINGIVIPKNRSVGINETVAKVSTGAIEYVPIVMVNNLAQSIEKLKSLNYWIVGTDANASYECKDIDKSLNIAVVIGSEGFGISRLVKDKCDYMVKIPMVGHVNSLNASVSAGIILAMLK